MRALAQSCIPTTSRERVLLLVLCADTGTSVPRLALHLTRRRSRCAQRMRRLVPRHHRTVAHRRPRQRRQRGGACLLPPADASRPSPPSSRPNRGGWRRSHRHWIVASPWSPQHLAVGRVQPCRRPQASFVRACKPCPRVSVRVPCVHWCTHPLPCVRDTLDHQLLVQQGRAERAGRARARARAPARARARARAWDWHLGRGWRECEPEVVWELAPEAGVGRLAHGSVAVLTGRWRCRCAPASVACRKPQVRPRCRRDCATRHVARQCHRSGRRQWPPHPHPRRNQVVALLRNAALTAQAPHPLTLTPSPSPSPAPSP